MNATAWNPHRHQLQAQALRLESIVRQKMLVSEGDVDRELATYIADIAGQTFESDEPSFQADEYKAELSALFDDNLRSAQSDMAAFAVAALYHHWERSVKWLIARKHRPELVKESNKADFGGLKDLLRADDLPADCQGALDTLDLGRLIANVIKHGEGPSAAAMRAKKAALFERPWRDKNFDLPSDLGVNLIWVQPADVNAVAGAICLLWETLPEDRFPPTAPLTLESVLNGDLD